MTQYEQVLSFCLQQNKTFTLAEVYSALDILQPNIRQLLQQVRDKGFIHFVDNKGTYVTVE